MHAISVASRYHAKPKLSQTKGICAGLPGARVTFYQTLNADLNPSNHTTNVYLLICETLQDAAQNRLIQVVRFHQSVGVFLMADQRNVLHDVFWLQCCSRLLWWWWQKSPNRPEHSWYTNTRGAHHASCEGFCSGKLITWVASMVVWEVEYLIARHKKRNILWHLSDARCETNFYSVSMLG